eukprot:3100958-Rhodomonas_salina.2
MSGRGIARGYGLCGTGIGYGTAHRHDTLGPYGASVVQRGTELAHAVWNVQYWESVLSDVWNCHSKIPYRMHRGIAMGHGMGGRAI